MTSRQYRENKKATERTENAKRPKMCGLQHGNGMGKRKKQRVVELSPAEAPQGKGGALLVFHHVALAPLDYRLGCATGQRSCAVCTIDSHLST